MVKKVNFKLCLSIFVVGLLSNSASAITYGYTHYYTLKVKPSIPATIPYNADKPIVRKMLNFYSCYSVYDGKPLDCPFIHTVHGLKEPIYDPENNGGHDGLEHNQSDRKFVYDNNELIHYLDSNPNPLIVEGSTMSSGSINPVARVLHEIPTASGKIMEEVFVSSPLGWSCANNCYSFKSRRYVTTYDVGYNNQVKLEAETDASDYIRVRGVPDLYHTLEEAYYGLPTTVETLKLISENYFILSERKLSINDMSLRKGGQFDVYGNWKSPHKSHREGKDVDLNRDGIDCKDDTDLFIAVDMLLPPVNSEEFNPYGAASKPTAINCEKLGKVDGARKHIDFEIDYTDYIGAGSFY